MNIHFLISIIFSIIIIYCCFNAMCKIIVRYMINKEWLDLECDLIDGLKPIHLICIYSTPEMIKYIIDKGVDLECANNDGYKPIHLIICRYSSTQEMIKYIIDKGVDLECANNDGQKPIHYICRFSTPEMIKYIIDKGVDLECANNDGWKPIHYICRYSTPEMMAYILENIEYDSYEEYYISINKLFQLIYPCILLLMYLAIIYNAAIIYKIISFNISFISLCVIILKNPIAESIGYYINKYICFVFLFNEAQSY